MTKLLPAPVGLLLQPLPDLAAWTDFFIAADIPVLASTAAELEYLRANEDAVDANSIGEIISNDPLMTLKVLAYASTHRASRVITDTETVTSALVMMGISPFFAVFGPQPTVEGRLALETEALAGLADTLRRAHRGANFALGMAVHRMDGDAAGIYTAALLQDFAELLLWCHAPRLALTISHSLQTDPMLRSSSVQRAILNVELVDLQQSLMRVWRLPELLIRISDARYCDHASVLNVALATRLARHTANSWDNPALADDIAEVSQLLNLSPAATLRWLRNIDSDAPDIDSTQTRTRV